MSEPPPPAELKPLRTWSHLADQRRRPSEYEIVSVKALYTTGNPDAVLELSPEVPMNRWYRRYRRDSGLRHPDWEAFRDPDALTYRAYCPARDRDETYVDGLLQQYSELDHDRKLPAPWVEQLARLYTPLRYLLHATQMAYAYLVVMAPCSTIANCAALQMGDQFRWLSRVAYRTAELRKTWPQAGFGARERAHWEQAAAWQPFRELMERLLAAYDWGEALIAINGAALPAVDAALQALAQGAEAQGDGLTRFLLEAQLKDAQRRVRWADALTAFAREAEGNADFIAGTLARWGGLAGRAVAAYREALTGAPAVGGPPNPG